MPDVVPQFPGYTTINRILDTRTVLDGRTVLDNRTVLRPYGIIGPTQWADNYAVKFDGVASYASFASAPLGIVGSYAASVSLWARRNTSFVPSVNGNNAFFSANTNAVCKLVPSTTGAVAFYLFRDVSGVLTGTTKTGPAMTVGQWYHLLWAYDSTIGWRCWVDGAEVGSVSLAGNGFPLGGAPGLTDYYIGRHANTYLDCNVDEVTIWNRAIAVNEVALANKPIDVTGASGLVRWYRMGDDYKWDSYKFSEMVTGQYPLSWVNAVQTTQVVPV